MRAKVTRRPTGGLSEAREPGDYPHAGMRPRSRRRYPLRYENGGRCVTRSRPTASCVEASHLKAELNEALPALAPAVQVGARVPIGRLGGDDQRTRVRARRRGAGSIATGPLRLGV